MKVIIKIFIASTLLQLAVTQIGSISHEPYFYVRSCDATLTEADRGFQTHFRNKPKLH